MNYRTLEAAKTAADDKATKYGGRWCVQAWYSGGYTVDAQCLVRLSHRL